VLLTRYFPVPGGGVEAGVPQMLLEQPEAITRVIQLHGMNGKGISETVRAYSTPFASGRVHQVAEASPVGTVPYYLPGAVPIDAEDHALSISRHRPAALDVALEHLKRIVIQRQGSHFAVLLSPGNRLLHLRSTSGAKGVGLSQPGTAVTTGDFYPRLQVLDGYHSPIKVYIPHRKG